MSFRIYSLCVLVLALSLGVITSGCPSSGSGQPSEKDSGVPDAGKPDSDDNAWVSQFKDELSRTESRFFEQRYLQRQEDPFYLNEVVLKLSPSKPLPKTYSNQVQVRKEDFQDSWPVLTEQLERVELIFAVTAVMPAYAANVAINKHDGSVNLGLAGMIAKFKQTVKDNAIFDKPKQQMDLSPVAKSEVVKLADNIVTGTLSRIQALDTDKLPSSLKKELNRYAAEMRLLNPAAGGNAGNPLNEDQNPHIENPNNLWNELGAIYKEIFESLEAIGKQAALHKELAAGHLNKERLKQVKVELAALDGTTIGQKLEVVKKLQAREAKILEQVVFATEKQFELTKLLIKKEE